MLVSISCLRRAARRVADAVVAGAVGGVASSSFGGVGGSFESDMLFVCFLGRMMIVWGKRRGEKC